MMYDRYDSERVAFSATFNQTTVDVNVSSKIITDEQKIAINEAVKMIVAAMKDTNVPA